jgi:hypothetical protein
MGWYVKIRMIAPGQSPINRWSDGTINPAIFQYECRREFAKKAYFEAYEKGEAKKNVDIFL